MKVWIIGAGAIGAYLAARMQQAGIDVCAIARGARLESLRRDGAMIDQGGSLERHHFPVTGWSDLAVLPDWVIIATKAPDLPEVLAHLTSLSGNDPRFLTLQNGVEAPDQVAALFPEGTVLAGRVHGFFEMEDGLVRHAGVQPSIAFGQIFGEGTEAEHELADMLERAGIDGVRCTDARHDLWEKFLLAASLGGAGLALGVPAGQVLESEEGRQMIGGALVEIVDLARCYGIALGPDAIDTTLAFIESFPRDVTTSLQRDVLAGRPSEYDTLPGAVLRLAQNVGLAVPVFHRIDAMCREQGLALPPA